MLPPVPWPWPSAFVPAIKNEHGQNLACVPLTAPLKQKSDPLAVRVALQSSSRGACMDKRQLFVERDSGMIAWVVHFGRQWEWEKKRYYCVCALLIRSISFQLCLWSLYQWHASTPGTLRLPLRRIIFDVLFVYRIASAAVRHPCDDLL